MKDLTEAVASELLVEVAHDFRSPLSAIVMMADAMRRGQSGPVTPDQDRQLAIISRAALSLCSTAADVIELARGDEQPARRVGVPFSVPAALDSVRDTVAPMLAGRNVELHFDVAAGISHRFGRASAFTRVLLNLVTNSLKHTDQGLIEVRVRECEHDIDALECAVSDTGRGMAPEVLRTVFSGSDVPDHAASLTSAGIGLSICRRLIETMGSALEVQSFVGVGTIFKFTLTLPRIAAVA